MNGPGLTPRRRDTPERANERRALFGARQVRAREHEDAKPGRSERAKLESTVADSAVLGQDDPIRVGSEGGEPLLVVGAGREQFVMAHDGGAGSSQRLGNCEAAETLVEEEGRFRRRA